MVVHVNQIPEEGLHFEGEEAWSLFDIDQFEIKGAGPVRYSLDVGLSGTGLFASGILEVDLQMICVRGLEVFTFPLRLDAFAAQVELEGVESIDLTPLMREDILLALPPHPRCDWNGESSCRGAGELKAHLNAGEQTKTAAEAWGELDKLKVKTTE